MTTSDTDVPDVVPPKQSRSGPSDAKINAANPKKLIIGAIGLALVIAIVLNGSIYLRDYDVPKLMQMVIATIGGVGGAYFFFYFMNMLVEGLPRKLSLAVIPYAFVLPAIGVLGVFLLYPAVQTIVYSFANNDSTEWVGLDNYDRLLHDEAFHTTLFNNVLWILIVPAFTVFLGLIIATLADKLSAGGEKFAKSIIFLPMAISFVGASTIWAFIYSYKPEGEPQIGILNAIVVKFGGSPVTWLQTETFNVNDLLLMVILIWMQVGFSMVLLSSAIKAVPGETLEAARIDGASEFQIFYRVIVPQIRGTLITVFITVLIMVLKVFDIVFVMTNGAFKTSVIALDFYKALFIEFDRGRASAIVVILLLAVLPILIYQVHHFREEEKTR